MKRLRVLMLGGLTLAALTLSGCFLTSAQIFVFFGLPNPFTIDSTTDPFERILVDLNTIDDYADNKDKLNGLSDIAVVGKFTNSAGPAGSVEVWMTAGVTNFGTVTEVKANGLKLWAGSIGAAPSTRTIGWDESAALFDAAGKTALLNEVKGDGTFTIYAFGTAGNYTIQVDDGAIILTINAGL